MSHVGDRRHNQLGGHKQSVNYKVDKAAEALFSLKRRRVALLEGELSAPGNEVAYIVKAKETFS